MYQKGFLLYNDKAGQDDGQKNVGIAAGILSKKVEELTILKGKAPGDLEKICKEQGERADILFIMGGDGTVHECVNGLVDLNNPPIISILPGGTCNDFARSLNVPMTIAEASVFAVNGKQKKIDIGYMNDRSFSNFVGIGLITEASENIDQEAKERTGTLSYFMSAMRSMKETTPFKYKINLNDGEYEGDAVMIVAMNGAFIGTRALPFEDISLEDGKLNLFIVKEGGIAIFREWFQRKGLFGQENVSENVTVMKGDQILMETEQPMKADSDGEIYLETPLKIGVKAQHLSFIADLQ
ncbi:lipid kinase [Salipaludibacillus keqinensis]|uniref:Lipid kinase n=1 Tax=Salipaludibacillus keqinensis TaxID=2045207 RepID=A0A323TDP7_9BACI|nr:YegS/Rv2252/BmrU family lipid kinase [Salipaludibacillus keqinensis]PYZ92344.1 lipid kinase [Salipaludibacillus keqinensis]